MKKTVLLSYTSGQWSQASLSLRLKSSSEPDLPFTVQFHPQSEVLMCHVESGQKPLTAHLRLRPAMELPESDHLSLEVSASPEKGGSPFRQQVEVLLFPYEVDYVVSWSDGRQQFLRCGDTLGLAQDGLTRLEIKARVFRVDSSGKRLSDRPVPVTGNLSQPPESSEVTIKADRFEDFCLRISSQTLQVGGASPAPIPLAFELAVPSGRRFDQRLLLQPQPLVCQLACPPEVLLGERATVELSLRSQDGRACQLAWKLNCPLGSCQPASGFVPAPGTTQLTYETPSLEEAEKSPGAWPRLVPLTLQLNRLEKEVARCQLKLLYRRKLSILIQKSGFQPLHRELEIERPGRCLLRLHTLVRGKPVALAWARVQAEGLAETTTDDQGRCALVIGGDGELSLPALNLELLTEIHNDQLLVVRGLQEGAAAGASPEYARAQKDLVELVEVACVERLASRPEAEFEATVRALIVLKGNVRVMNQARALFLRRFDRVKVNLETTFKAILTAFWDLFLGQVLAGILQKTATCLTQAVLGLARSLAGFRLIRSGLSLVVAAAESVQKAFLGCYQKVFDKVQRLLTDSPLPGSLKERLALDPSRGPVPLDPGAIAAAIKAQLSQGLEQLASQREQLRAGLKLVQTRLAVSQSALAKAEAGPKMAQLSAQIESLEAELARVSGQLQKSELELAELSQRHIGLEEMADRLDTLVHLLGAILNMAFNLLVAVSLSLPACLLKAIQPAVREAGLSSALLERLAKLLEDIVGDLLADFGSQTGAQDNAVQILKHRLLATQRCLAGSSLTFLYEKLKVWPDLDGEHYKEALRFYYQQVENNEFRSQASEVIQDFMVWMIDGLETLAIWSSRLGVLFASVVAVLASAGTAVPAAALFSASANASLEAAHRLYVALKAGAHASDSLGSLALAVGIALPAHVEFTVRTFQDESLRERAAAPLTLPSLLMDPDFRNLAAG